MCRKTVTREVTIEKLPRIRQKCAYVPLIQHLADNIDERIFSVVVAAASAALVAVVVPSGVRK